MEKKQSMAVVKMIAAAIIALVLTIPFTSATEIKIYSGTTQAKADISLDNYVEKTVEVSGQSVHIALSPRQGYEVERVQLYLCGGSLPTECMDRSPIEYDGSVDTWLSLPDISSGGRAGIMMLIRLNTTSWLGSWTSIVNSQPHSDELALVETNATADAGQVASFARENGMLPAGWILSGDTFFRGADELLVIGANEIYDRWFKQALEFNFSYSGGRVENREAEYAFAFPVSGGKIMEPVTMHSNPGLQCGDSLCEIGETCNSCCTDCGCPENMTCTGTGCINSSEVHLVINSVKPNPINCLIVQEARQCSFLETLNLEVELVNPPVDYRVLIPYFMVGNSTYTQISCLPGNGNTFSCSLFLEPEARKKGFSLSREFAVFMPVMQGVSGQPVLASGTGIMRVKGIDLDIVELEGFRERMREIQSKIDSLENIFTALKVLEAILTAILVFQLAMAVYNAAMSTMYYAYSNSCCPDPECVSCSVYVGMSNWYWGQAEVWWESSGVTDWELWLVGAAILFLEYMLKRWVNEKKEDMENKLKQRIAYANSESDVDDLVDKIVDDQMISTVWADGNRSGRYVREVCDGEGVKLFYNMQSLQCEKDLWLGMGGSRVPGEFYVNGTHSLANGTASLLLGPGKKLNVTLHCDSRTFGKNITETFDLLNYTEVCK